MRAARQGLTLDQVADGLHKCSDNHAYVLLLHVSQTSPDWFDHLGEALFSHAHTSFKLCNWAYSGDPAVHAAFNLTDGEHVAHADAPSGSHHLPAIFLCARSKAKGDACARPQDAITADDIPAWKSMELEHKHVEGFRKWFWKLIDASGSLFDYVAAGPYEKGVNAKAIPIPQPLLKNPRNERPPAVKDEL